MSTKIASLYAEIGAKTEGFEQGAKKVKGGMGDLKTTWISAAATFAIVGRELQKDIMAASDLAESSSKVGVVFGDNAKIVEDWSNTTANGLGISQQAALEAAGTYGNLFTALGLTQEAAAGMSTELVGLAADLASFNNQNPEDVLMALRSGLSGEVEPLKRFGIAMNQATMEAKAMELGLGDNVQALTEAEKVQVRYAIILDQTTTAQGDFDRTSQGLANTMRQLKANTEDLRAGLGQAFEPTVTNVANAVNDLTASLAGSIKAENALLQAVEDGLITQEDANRQINKFTWTSYTAADAMEWLTEKQDENARGLEAVTTLYGSYDKKFEQHNMVMEEAAAITKEMSDANRDWLGLLGDEQKIFDDTTDKLIDYGEKRQELLDKIAATPAWDTLHLEEYQSKLDELNQDEQEYTDNYEIQSKRRILSIAEEQLAQDGLTTQEMQYLEDLGVAWGVYSQSAVDARRDTMRQVNDIIAGINTLPENKRISVEIRAMLNTIGISSGGLSNMPGFAEGGSFIVPQQFGHEGFNMGGVATASGGERISISRDENGSSNSGMVSLDPQSMRTLATTIVKVMQAG